MNKGPYQINITISLKYITKIIDISYTMMVLLAYRRKKHQSNSKYHHHEDVK